MKKSIFSLLFVAPSLLALPCVAAADEPLFPAFEADVSLSQRLAEWRRQSLNRAAAFPLHNRPVVYPHQPWQPSFERLLSIQAVRQAEATPSAAESLFPASWKWRSERKIGTQSTLLENARVAERWRLGVDVPVSHPWGVATFSANYNQRVAGAAEDREMAAGGEGSGADISLRQDLQIGKVSGNAQIALSQDGKRDNSMASTAAPAAQSAADETSANLRWQATPSLALTTAHRNRTDRSKNKISEDAANSSALFARQSSTQNNHEVGLEWKASSNVSVRARATESNVATLAQPGEDAKIHNEREESRREVGVDWQALPNVSVSATAAQNSVDTLAKPNETTKSLSANDETNAEVGLNWKWTKSLSVAARAGQTRAGYADGSDATTPRWLRDEQRAVLSLQRRTSAGAWGMDVSRRWANQEMGGDDDRRSDNVSLNAERRLASWLSVRGAWRVAGEGNYVSKRFDDSAQREAEAQLQLKKLGSVALRYSDLDNQSTSIGGDVLGSGGAREYGVRYNTANNGGLGLALEYSVRDQRIGDDTSTWKVGVTYR